MMVDKTSHGARQKLADEMEAATVADPENRVWAMTVYDKHEDPHTSRPVTTDDLVPPRL